MTRLRYIGDGEECTVFGHLFERGEWVDAAALLDQAVHSLALNPTFEAEGYEAPAPVVVEEAPARDLQAELDMANEHLAEKDALIATLQAHIEALVASVPPPAEAPAAPPTDAPPAA